MCARGAARNRHEEFDSLLEKSKQLTSSAHGISSGLVRSVVQLPLLALGCYVRMSFGWADRVRVGRLLLAL